MRWLPGVLVAAALALGSGCTDTLPPEGQLVLTVVTDAPLPPPTGFGDGPLPLFDRLRFDIIPPGATEPCGGCSREFGVDRDRVSRGEASIGIAPPVGETGWRVRVRLYRSGGTASPEPRPASTLETVVALPAIAEEGKRQLSVVLWTDDVATPVGTLEAPVSPLAGQITGLVGSWPGARVRGCVPAAEPGTVCVPGGAFWMGDPRLDLSSAFDLDGELERLVVLSPFYLDQTEVPVSAFRASGLAQPLQPGGPSNNPHEPDSAFPDCTYTSEPGPFDDYPTVCLSWTKAEEYCEQRGARLPTESEIEYALSARGRSTYVWGEESPRCEDAVYERGSVGDLCFALGRGITPPGAGARDRLALAGGEVVDLAGNAKEWALDRWNRQTEDCWGTGVFVDPFCDRSSPTDGDARSVRGSDWADDALSLRAAIRHRIAGEELAVSARVGFRCARDAGGAL